MKRIVLTLTLMIVFIEMLGISTNVHKVEAPYPIIFIRADGSIDPPKANITSLDNVTYTFTSDINASIVVEKDNITVDGAGYTLQGTVAEYSRGINLTRRSNITIKNMEIKTFWSGIWLDSSSFNTISRNNITNNEICVCLAPLSNNNIVYGNNITANTNFGIGLWDSSNNSIYGNNLVDNEGGIGILLYGSTHNHI